MASTRATLRSSLTRKTDAQLTVAADLDIYLNLADSMVQNDWSQFDKSILTPSSRTSGTTDSNGVLLLTALTVEIYRIENSNNVEFPPISIDERWSKTGYYFAGWGNSNTQRQVVIMQSGAVLASTTVYFYPMVLSAMGSQTTNEPVIPEEFRDIIAVKAAQLWFEEQGPPLQGTAEKWEARYGRWLERARRAYKTLDNKPIFAKSYDPDAGGGGFYTIHRT